VNRRTTMTKFSIVFSALLFAACPRPAVPALTSIDGLEGGALTTKLTVPALAADEVQAPTANLDAVTSTSTATESLTATDVIASTVATEKITVRGSSLFGLPVGVVPNYEPRADPEGGYRHADAACKTAFSDDLAHVCSSEEALFAFRDGVDLDASFDGASVNTYSFTVVGQHNTDNERFYVANDCDGWTSTSQASSERVLDDNVNNDRRANLGFQPVRTWIDAHMTLFAGRQIPSWRLRPNIDGCIEVKLA